MRIQFKRNNSSSSTLPTSSTVNAGEPLWFKDELYIGSVGTSAGGTEGTAGTPILAVRTKALDTTSTTSLEPSASESFRGAGVLKLHKIAKTGSYNDLTNKPTIPINSDFSLSGLSDTTVSSPSNGQVLTYNGSAWVNSTPAATSDEKLALSVVPYYLSSDPSKDFSIIVTDNSDTPITTAKTRQYTKDLKLTIDNSEAEAILSVGGYYNIGKLKLEYQSSGGCTELATDHLWFNDSSNNIGLKLYTNVNEWTNYQHEVKIPYKSGTIALTSDLPAAQVNADWNSSSGVSQILNKPTLATVATSGSYNDLSNKPTIPNNSDFSLSGLSDTTISSASDGQILTYNGTSGKWENTSGSETPLQIVTFYYSNNNYACDTSIDAIMQKLALGWEIRGQFVDQSGYPDVIKGYELCCTYGEGDFVTDTGAVGNTVTFTADLGDSVVILTGLIASGPADTWTWEQIPQEKIKVINLTMTETQVGMTCVSDTSVQDIHNYVVDGYLVFANASITGQPTKAMLPLIIDMSNNGVYVVGFKLFMLNEGVLVIGYSDGVNDVWELDYNAEVYKCVFTNNNGAYSCSMDVSDVIDKAVEDHMYIFGVEQDSNDTYLKYYTFVGAHGDLSDEEAVNNYVEFSYTNGTTIEILKGTITANGDTWAKTTTALTCVRYDTASQGLTSTQQSNARTNIGAGTSNFSGSYNDLTNKPTIPTNSDFSLVGLSDTTVSSPSNGQVLTYNSTSGKWVNSNASGSGTLLEEKTYAQLQTMVAAGTLVPGQKYRMTNFVTTTNDGFYNSVSSSDGFYYEYQSAEHPFDLVLTAISDTEFDCKAQAVLNDDAEKNNPYFIAWKSDLSKWQIWYDFEGSARYRWTNNYIELSIGKRYRAPHLDSNGYYAWIEINDGYDDLSNFLVFTDSRFPEVNDTATTDGGTDYPIISVSTHYGVIYRMIDEFGNDCPYDFKNIQFKRNVSGNSISDKFTKFTNIIDSSIARYLNDWTNYSYDYYYTFQCLHEFWAGDMVGDSLTDATLEANYDIPRLGTLPKQRVQVYGNVIKPFMRVNTLTPKDEYYVLNDIVFLNYIEYAYSSSQGDYYEKGFNCYNNVFDKNCSSMTIGHNCTSNSFGTNCYGNLIGDNSYVNTFGYGFISNNMGNITNCDFGKNCNHFTMPISSFTYNTFGDDCSYISIEFDYFQRNTIEKNNKGFELYDFDSQITYSNKLQFVTFKQYLNYDSNNLFSEHMDNYAGRTYITTLVKATDGTIMDCVPTNAANNSY